MASRLFELAKRAAQYLARGVRRDEGSTGGDGRPQTGNAPDAFGFYEDDGGDEEYDDIQLLGRDASYDLAEFGQMLSKMRKVTSSNVYSYAFEQESESMGILYVTFLDYQPKNEARGVEAKKLNTPGPTYAYYNFPLLKFKQFEQMAESSAGSAVWDFCRVRHSAYEHQHTYRLIHALGEYVPRKATAAGFSDRSIAGIGIGPRASVRRNTLESSKRNHRRALPNRGTPNRGTPNRG